VKFDQAGQPKQRIGTPPIESSIAPQVLNVGVLAASPAGDRFALAFQHLSTIELLTPSGAPVGVIDGPQPTHFRVSLDSLQRKLFWKDDDQWAFVDAATSDQYVYALFCGCTRATRNERSRILVARWNGELVADLRLDRAIAQLTVSPDDHWIYAAYGEGVDIRHMGLWALPPRLQYPGSLGPRHSLERSPERTSVGPQLWRAPEHPLDHH
jgi:hypothetical protein